MEHAEVLRSTGRYRPFGPLKGGVAANRTGPHNLDVLAALFGSLLGDMCGTWSNQHPNFRFFQGEVHSPYLLF